MKKIKAKTQFKHAVSKGSFMKELLEIMGRLSIKLNDDELEVVDVQDECLSEVIDLIDDYSWISEIHICENEESSEEALVESSEMPSEQAEDEAVEEGARDEATAELAAEDTSSSQEKTAENATSENNHAESKDNAVVNKVVFDNEVIEEYLNKLLKTISWAINYKYASTDDIKSILLSAMDIMSMKYNPKYPECSVGDIVVVNYCHNLYNETGGGYVHGIVCDIPDEYRILVIPIGKINKRSSKWHIPFSAPYDVTYLVDGYNEAIAIIDQTRYINRERINRRADKPIVGKVKPKFFNKLLDMLPKVFTFDNRMPIEDDVANCADADEATNGSLSDEIANIAESANDDESERSIPSSTDELEPEDAYDSSEDVDDAIAGSSISDDVPQDVIDANTDVDIQSVAEGSSSEVAKVMAEQESTKNVLRLTYEEALNEIIGEALEEVDCFGTMTDEVRQFIANIGMDTSDGYLVQAFIKACEVKKITMDNIAGAVCVMAGVKQSHIENSLKKTFKQWIEQYPEFKAKFPKISLTAILKAFANKMQKVE